MRTCVAFVSLVLLLVATTAHGIRLDRQLQEAINTKQKMAYPTSGESSVARPVNKHCSPVDGHCSSASGTMKETTPAVVDGKGSQVMIGAYAAPVRFHEDYYGPSGHEPNHH
ncbi:hypothetical protein PR202_ga26379 [Eleusine coracana subsp. coracana]|uniref:Uncharacterized protein n=1 Tax=Eleusine coracana subsp. coracana TaxID=191504 RepID=A0AAV5DBU1_ELECO|nr:hypothetical protein PR202_ga26379 [Eleusine coracana subsp. coracana]